jgi:hypothetical protein
MAEFVDRLYYEDEATVGLAYGGFLGTGKSSYCIKVAAEVLGSHPGFPENKPDYEAVKQILDFTPKLWVDRVLKMTRREKIDILDDMGLWWFALDWYDPFVKAAVKYLNVARTDWAFIFGNTPSPRLVVSFVQNFPELIRVKITKEASNVDHPNKPRIAKAYQVWNTPDLRKTGVKRVFEDRYNAIMPDDFFGWYKPLRDRYALLAKEMMLKQLTKLKKVDKDNLVETGYSKTMPLPEKIKELEEVVAQLEQGEGRF